MKWEGNRESDNVEDVRGSGGGGGGDGFGFGGRSVGIGTIVIALVGGWIFGINPMTILNIMSGGGGAVPVQQEQRQGQAPGVPANDRGSKFVRVVLADTEDVWTALFREQGGTYQKPALQLFSGRTQTACGAGQSATGPFYCPADRKVYLDMSFFQLMEERFKVEGEFAQAYVIAHEIGHHVQHSMGLTDKVDQARQRGTEKQANAMSVRLELQADCFAGVWAFHANQSRAILEQGDVDAALKAATAIGDDALQRQSQGHVVPDSFTHGSSEQRARWFKRGLDEGKVASCDTFAARQL
ncbi:KPN_02809 family neutral zinc metallopeptidase [Massilia pseudoviolaceinigra]|uniref:KPN_02809 family neutral zinc metallopeptidase n=1 Tax=Massilia pseudoviolaceinigra TaxID=3057165 RepID=UPI002796C16B|nr:neutral zinc metallopeptidase [Massilia sp. CCM 9206]MDQ1922648.1 neutral zinc metallopeptidase [Massilia sp. CCM 9206]